MTHHEQKFHEGDCVRLTREFERIMGTDQTFVVLGKSKQNDGDGLRYIIAGHGPIHDGQVPSWNPTVPHYGLRHA
jgi:hypothetical protein